MENKTHNYFVDFLKFTFSIIILLYHTWSFAANKELGLFKDGYLAVNFYFLVTGYLMMNSLHINNSDSFSFIKNKIKRLLPGLVFALFICCFFVFFGSNFDLSIFFLTNVLGDIFLLSCWNIGGALNAAWWYISAMLILLSILYPLAKKYRKKYITIVAPLILIFILLLIYYFNIDIDEHVFYVFSLKNGCYKGIIYIILGNISYELSKCLRKVKTTNFQRKLFTITEILLYIILVINMYNSYLGKITVALLFTISVTITFSNISLTSNIFNNKIWNKLSNYGFYIYLTHVSIRTFLLRRNTNIYFDMLFKYLLISLVTALFMYIVLEIIYPKLKNT